MPKLAREDPPSFDVERFILSLQFDDGSILSLLNPGPDGSGRGPEIFYTLLNIPIIGMTFRPTPNQANHFGFVPNGSCNTDNCQDDPGSVFDSEALLVLDVDSSMKLPTEFRNSETWIIQVKDSQDEDRYTLVAEALIQKFGVNVIITSASMKRTARYTEAGIPVDPKYPKGALWCPIGVTRIKTKGEKKN
jgi:hypothetical protein